MTRSVHSLALPFVTAFALLACSSSTSSSSSGSSGASSSSGGTTLASSDCQSRCEKKVTGCGANASDATGQCQASVCNTSVTDAQMSCFENHSCTDLQAASSFASLCPAQSSSSSGGNGSSSGGNSSFTCNGNSCNASTQFCDQTYDSASSAWKDSACKAIPDACKTASDICECLLKNNGCSTGGVISTHCASSNGAVSFGCQ